jgi:intracellular sulfur oxidation DsrE/DsrF family protein
MSLHLSKGRTLSTQNSEFSFKGKMDMRNATRVEILLGIFWAGCLGFSPFIWAAEPKGYPEQRSLRIDIPVTIEKANVVFNMDHLAFAGDMPVGIKYMGLLVQRLKEMKTKGRIIGIFHGDAAYMTLNDQSYNSFRNVKTGNPYKELIADLINQGVQIEECAVSMKSHNWGNENLLPGVKVNTGAVGRLIQLTQEGYAQIQP